MTSHDSFEPKLLTHHNSITLTRFVRNNRRRGTTTTLSDHSTSGCLGNIKVPSESSSTTNNFHQDLETQQEQSRGNKNCTVM